MVPRALTIQRRQAKGDVKISEKSISVGPGVQIPRSRYAPVVLSQKKVEREEQATQSDKDMEESRPITPTRMATEPVSVPSKPVVIPPRSPSLAAASSRRKGKSNSRRGSRPPGDSHNPRAVPSSVAALLAVIFQMMRFDDGIDRTTLFAESAKDAFG